MKDVILFLLIVLASYSPLFGQEEATKSTVYQVETMISDKPSLVHANQIDVYPNPATDYVIVSVKHATIKDLRFELYSVIGKKINVVPERIGMNTYKFKLKDLNAGYYFVIVKNDIVQFKKGKKFLKHPDNR